MPVVLDANIIVSLVLPLPYSDSAAEKVVGWKQEGEILAAPALWSYEVTSVLRRAQTGGYLRASQLDAAIESLYRLRIEEVPPTLDLQRRSLSWAERLGQSKAYDSAYLAAAEELGAAFWTADRSLARAARDAGAGWVHSIVTE